MNRAKNDGKDPTGLSKWIRMCFQGCNGHMMRLVSIYQPYHGSNGASSVYAHYVRYFKGKKEQDRNPRIALYKDLFVEATKWKTEGDHIIIAGNMNEDVRKGLTNGLSLPLG
jgi:hypothetical protein